MNRVALYSFNKIAHALVRYREFLKYEIVSVIDFMMPAGKDAGEEIMGQNIGVEITDNIDYGLDKSDLLILCEPGTPMEHYKDYYFGNNLDKKWKELVKRCKGKNIKIFSIHEIVDAEIIEWLNKNNISIEYDFNERKSILEYINRSRNIISENKIRRIGIFGTQSCIGKFTAQMNLYKKIRQFDNVTNIITEPTGKLFGFNQLANFRISNTELANYIDSIIRNEEKNGVEYVLIADQGWVAETDNLGWILGKISILKGFAPDEIIIVAGYEDDEKIQKTIDFIKIFTGIERPLAIFIPDKLERQHGVYIKKSKNDVNKRIVEIQEKFNPQIVSSINEIENTKMKFWRKNDI